MANRLMNIPTCEECYGPLPSFPDREYPFDTCPDCRDAAEGVPSEARGEGWRD